MHPDRVSEIDKRNAVEAAERVRVKVDEGEILLWREIGPRRML
jgi:hypothetical protein